jgi:ketosteroid isomerase-like protein
VSRCVRSEAMSRIALGMASSLALGGACAPARAQTPASGEVVRVVERMFAAMESRDTTTPHVLASADAAIRGERARFNDAIARRDTAAIAATFLPTYHVVSGSNAQQHGVEAARRRWAEIFRTDPAATYMRTPREIRVNVAWGLAEELGDWDGRVTSGGAVSRVGGTYAAKWVRSAAGAWRLQSEVFTTLRCDGGTPAACTPPPPPR